MPDVGFLDNDALVKIKDIADVERKKQFIYYSDITLGLHGQARLELPVICLSNTTVLPAYRKLYKLQSRLNLAA